jgi:hypothetical protein
VQQYSPKCAVKQATIILTSKVIILEYELVGGYILTIIARIITM